MILRKFLIVSVCLAGLSHAYADDDDLATALGSVLAGEGPCGLNYNQNEISSFISKNVSANDMSFSSTLNMMTQGEGVQIEQMTPSEKTAFCEQTKRVAESYGFIGQ